MQIMIFLWILPYLLVQKILTVSPLGDDTGCRISMSYNNATTSHVLSIDLNGVNTSQTIAAGYNLFFIDVLIGESLLSLDGRECLYVTCISVNEVVNLQYTVPNIDIVSQSDEDVIGQIDLYSDLNYTIDQVDDIHQTLDTVRDKLSEIADQLSQLNFNISEQNPFGNFTLLREQTDYLLGLLNASLNSSSSDTTDDCSGIFGSAACYFQDFAGSIITVVVAVAVLIIIFMIIKKSSKNKKGRKKLKVNVDYDEEDY